MFVGGYSIGGYLAALLASDPTYMAQVDLSIRDIKAAIPIAGTYDIVDYYKTLAKEKGHKFANQHVKAPLGVTMKELKAVSPTNYVDFRWVPMLIVSEPQTYRYASNYERVAKAAKNYRLTFYHVQENEQHGFYSELAQQKHSKHRDRIIDYILKNHNDYHYLNREISVWLTRFMGKVNPFSFLMGAWWC